MDATLFIVLAAAAAIILLLVVLVILIVIVVLLLSPRISYNNGHARKVRESLENAIARTIPEQMDNDVDIELLEDVHKRIGGLIANKKHRKQTVDDGVQSLMDTLNKSVK